MAKLFSIKPGITIRGRAFKGLRGWAGKPFHPPLTDIPVAAYFVGRAGPLRCRQLAPVGGLRGLHSHRVDRLLGLAEVDRFAHSGVADG